LHESRKNNKSNAPIETPLAFKESLQNPIFFQKSDFFRQKSPYSLNGKCYAFFLPFFAFWGKNWVWGPKIFRKYRKKFSIFFRFLADFGSKKSIFGQKCPKMKNFENPKIGQNRLFSVKKVDFWPPKVDFRPKMARK